MNLWNVKNLDSPPVTTYLAKNYDVDTAALRIILSVAVNVIKNQKQLEEEAAILSRCIYRMKMKFRNDKGLKSMEKINHALLHYLRMNFPYALQTFHDIVPQKYSHKTYLPSRNMLHYVLVCLQSVSKLMARIIHESKTSAQYMSYRIRIGHFWNLSFICYGIVSRLFVLTMNIFQCCCKLYPQLLPFANKLKTVGVDWLPQGYSFPPDLKSWLDTDLFCLDKNETIKPSLKPKSKLSSIFNIREIVDPDSDVEIYGDYIDLDSDVELVGEFTEVKDDENNITALATKENRLKNLTLDEDIGEVVKPDKVSIARSNSSIREDVGEVVNMTSKLKSPIRMNKKRKKLQQMSKPSAVDVLISNIKTLEDLQVFSSNFKNIQIKHSNAFKKVDKMQCNMLHSAIKKCLKKAKKHSANELKLNLCVSKAKEALKQSLD